MAGGPRLAGIPVWLYWLVYVALGFFIFIAIAGVIGFLLLRSFSESLGRTPAPVAPQVLAATRDIELSANRPAVRGRVAMRGIRPPSGSDGRGYGISAGAPRIVAGGASRSPAASLELEDPAVVLSVEYPSGSRLQCTAPCEIQLQTGSCSGTCDVENFVVVELLEKDERVIGVTVSAVASSIGRTQSEPATAVELEFEPGE